MTRRSLVVPAEVALVAVTAAMVLGFLRLFDGRSFLLPLLVTAIVAHVVTAAARRRRLGLVLTAGIDVVAAVVLTGWLFYLSTTLLGLPTPATFGAAGDDLARSWELFRDVVAPAPPEPGFLVASALGVWLVAYLADWAAFRLWSTIEAIVPAATLFVFASMLGSDEHRLLAAGTFLAAVLAFVLVHRSAIQLDQGTWIGSSATGVSSLLTRGSAVAAGAVAVALVVGPALPGADDPAVVAWRDLDGGSGSRVTLSPLVDIRKRLVDQADVEVFTVEADQRAYWRLTALDTFDGTIWKSRGDYEDADGELPGTLADDLPTVPATQRFEIEALAALWLPAAYEPRRVEGDGLDIVFEANSSTLIVGSDHPDSDGLAYTVTSSLPRPDPAVLASAGGEVPPEIAARYLALPDDFDPAVAATAEEVVAGATTPYERARALQDWFRAEFTYSLDIDAGHSQGAIEAFLASRQGYCEQFAGTYAAMARSLGLPARVAVGFTPGTVDPERPDRYVVRGQDAHAWPEVYFAGAGWVGFEPTPGRGAPGAEAYTGVPEPASDADPTSSTTAPAAAAPTAPSPTPSTPGDLDASTGALEAGGADPGDADGRSALATAALVVVILVAAVAVYVGAMAAAHRLRRSTRRRHARDGRARVRVAWAEAQAALAPLGVRPGTTETAQEFAGRATALLGLGADDLGSLAVAVTAADYAPYDPTDDEVQQARVRAHSVEEAAGTRVTRWQRVGALLDPRSLLPVPGSSGDGDRMGRRGD